MSRYLPIALDAALSRAGSAQSRLGLALSDLAAATRSGAPEKIGEAAYVALQVADALSSALSETFANATQLASERT